MEDKDFSLYFEVVCSLHPTEMDLDGRDGIFIKSIKWIRQPKSDVTDKEGFYCDCLSPIITSHYGCRKCGRPVRLSSSAVESEG